MSHPLSRHLRRLVEERTGLTVNQFAGRIGLNASGLHQIVRGERDSIESTTIEKIAAGLGMTPAELMGMIGQGPASADPDLTLLASLLRQVPAGRKSHARRAAEAVLLTFIQSIARDGGAQPALAA